MTIEDLASFLSGRDALRAEEYPCMALLETLGVKVIRKSRQKIFEEKQPEILQDMPDTKVLSQIMPNMSGFIVFMLTFATEQLVSLFKDLRLWICCVKRRGSAENRVRKLRGEETKKNWEEVRKKEEFTYECRRKWKEQGKTEEECKRMWPQALADWRAENEIAADFDAMQI